MRSPDFTDTLSIARSGQSRHIYVEGDNSYVVLKPKGKFFVDANGMHWKPVAFDKRFSRAAAFTRGIYKRILGKGDLPEQVIPTLCQAHILWLL